MLGFFFSSWPSTRTTWHAHHHLVLAGIWDRHWWPSQVGRSHNHGFVVWWRYVDINVKYFLEFKNIFLRMFSWHQNIYVWCCPVHKNIVWTSETFFKSDKHFLEHENIYVWPGNVFQSDKSLFRAWKYLCLTRKCFPLYKNIFSGIEELYQEW